MASFIFGAIVGGVFAALGMVYLVGSGLLSIKPVEAADDTSEFDGVLEPRIDDQLPMEGE